MRLPLCLLAAAILAVSAQAPSQQVRAGHASVPDERSVEALDGLLDRHVSNGFSGVVLIARGSEPILFRGYGSLDGRAIEDDDRFWLASTGKQFAGAAIFKLIEQGRLDLDDPLSRFFPSAPREKSGITIRQLLTHRSGFGQSFVSEGVLDRSPAVNRMLAEPLKGEPGDEFRYSNSNTQLVAAVVEVASGLPYQEFVTRFLWSPAGLMGTGFAGPQTSSSVSPIPGGELPERLKQAYWGEQGVFSTACDLLRWSRALRSGRILTNGSIAEMFSPAVKIGEGYATPGWFRGSTSRGAEFIFVRGNEDFGANSLVYLYPANDVTVIVLTHAGNADDETSWSRRVLGDVEQSLGL